MGRCIAFLVEEVAWSRRGIGAMARSTRCVTKIGSTSACTKSRMSDIGTSSSGELTHIHIPEDTMNPFGGSWSVKTPGLHIWNRRATWVLQEDSLLFESRGRPGQTLCFWWIMQRWRTSDVLIISLWQFAKRWRDIGHDHSFLPGRNKRLSPLYEEEHSNSLDFISIPQFVFALRANMASWF